MVPSHHPHPGDGSEQLLPCTEKLSSSVNALPVLSAKCQPRVGWGRLGLGEGYCGSVSPPQWVFSPAWL